MRSSPLPPHTWLFPTRIPHVATKKKPQISSSRRPQGHSRFCISLDAEKRLLFLKGITGSQEGKKKVFYSRKKQRRTQRKRQGAVRESMGAHRHVFFPSSQIPVAGLRLHGKALRPPALVRTDRKRRRKISSQADGLPSLTEPGEMTALPGEPTIAQTRFEPADLEISP